MKKIKFRVQLSPFSTSHCFVIILVALVVPTITKLPKYNEDHATISAQIADCDDVLANQTSVEAKIDEMTQQYNENQEALYIDANHLLRIYSLSLLTSALICHHLTVVKVFRMTRAEHQRAVFRFLKQIFLSATTAQKRTHSNLFITLNRNQRVVTLLIHS